MTTMLDDPGLPDTEETTSGSNAHTALAGALGNYRRLSEEISSYEAQCLELEAQESEAINNQDLSEDEQVRRISEAQIRRSVQSSRAAKKRELLKATQEKLESVVMKAEGELRGAVGELLDERRALLKAQVLKALGYDARPFAPSGLAQLVEGSPLIRSVEACRPVNAAFSHLSAEERAQEAINKLEILSKLKERSI